MVGEFYDTGVHHEENKICEYIKSKKKNELNNIYILSGSDVKKTVSLNGENVFSLSKNDFCDNVVNDIENFNDFNFENFKLIIDIIDEIIKKMN